MFSVFASVNVEVPGLEVGSESLIIMCHLLSRLAPLMMSAIRSLWRSVFLDAIVRNGFKSSLQLLNTVGMRDDISDAIACLAW